MDTAKIFQNGQSQAVRLPKEFRFDSDHVLIRRVGNAVILQSPEKSWDTLLDSLEQFTPEFMDDRAQPPVQEREDL